MQTRHRAGGGNQPDGYYPIGFSVSCQDFHPPVGGLAAALQQGADEATPTTRLQLVLSPHGLRARGTLFRVDQVPRAPVARCVESTAKVRGIVLGDAAVEVVRLAYVRLPLRVRQDVHVVAGHETLSAMELVPDEDPPLLRP